MRESEPTLTSPFLRFASVLGKLLPDVPIWSPKPIAGRIFHGVVFASGPLSRALAWAISLLWLDNDLHRGTLHVVQSNGPFLKFRISCITTSRPAARFFTSHVPRA